VVVPSPATSDVFEATSLDLFRDRHAVLGDRGAAEFLVENDVAPTRAECGLYGFRQFLDTAQQRVPRVFIEL
jgi:hypothetical protein